MDTSVSSLLEVLASAFLFFSFPTSCNVAPQACVDVEKHLSARSVVTFPLSLPPSSPVRQLGSLDTYCMFRALQTSVADVVSVRGHVRLTDGYPKQKLPSEG